MIFYILLILVFIEQIFYFYFYKYPYRYGILVKTISIPNLESLFFSKEKSDKYKNLTIKMDDQNKELYLHYRYPFGLLGPLFFVGQMQKDRSNKLMIRVGYIFLILILSIAVLSFSSKDLVGFIRPLLMPLLVIWFYRRFLNAIKKYMERTGP